MRRLTVLSPPFQLVFPDQTIIIYLVESNLVEFFTFPNAFNPKQSVIFFLWSEFAEVDFYQILLAAFASWVGVPKAS